MVTERTRSRWYLGNALLGVGRCVEAIETLRVAWREFAELRLTVEAALAALDLAEALLASEQPAEVPEICREAVALLTAADLAMRAVPALALLREAAAMGGVTREHLRDAQVTVRMSTPRSAYFPGDRW